MIGFLLYALTASFALFGYLLLKVVLPTVAAAMHSATTGATLLLVAALLTLWKRRVAAGIALLGSILIWFACWFLSYGGLHSGAALFMSFAVYMFPVLAVVCVPLALTTLYSFLSVTALN